MQRDKNITIRDIAALSHVSVSTVSKCLNGYKYVNPETKARIERIVKETHYVPSAFASNNVSKKMQIIGLTIPDVRDPYFAQSAYGIEEELSKTPYRVLYGSLDRSEEKLLEFFSYARSLHFRGMIITPDVWSPEVLAQIKSLPFPVVSLRRRPSASFHIPFVDSDHYKGSTQMMEYLYGKGHRNIAHIALDTEAGRIRERAYLDFCAGRGLQAVDVKIPHKGNVLSDAYVVGYQGTKEIMAGHRDVTAIYAASDLIAYGVFCCLAEHGKKVPEDISVVGIGNMEYSALPLFNLTTLELFRYDMGVSTAKLMLRMISSENAGDNILFGFRVVERGSVKNVSERGRDLSDFLPREA